MRAYSAAADRKETTGDFPDSAAARAGGRPERPLPPPGARPQPHGVPDVRPGRHHWFLPRCPRLADRANNAGQGLGAGVPARLRALLLRHRQLRLPGLLLLLRPGALPRPEPPAAA